MSVEYNPGESDEEPEPASSGADGSGTSGQRSGSLLTAIRPVGGILYGVIAFVLSSAGVLVLFFSRISNESAFESGPVPIEGIDILKKLEWVVYNAHSVSVKPTGELVIGADGINYVTSGFLGDPLLFQLIPAVVLFLFGLILAWRVDRSLSPPEAMLAGGSLAFGYGAVAVAGSVLLQIGDTSVTWGAPLVPSLLLMGIAYPVVCGGVGGLLGG